jgi:uncharacterized membrane protein YccC
MPVLPSRLTFSVANTAAVLVALYIAFARDLERPYWAMFTVFIIAKPISGAVRSKAIYRFFGTCAGACMALFLVPPLVHAPVLLCVAMCGWVGVCLYLSLLDRTPRSYALLLAGYTASIVGLAVVDTPQGIFDIAISRVEEISLGIICGSIAHSVFFPKNIARDLTERIHATVKACADWIAGAMKRSPALEDISAQRRLALVVTELHVLYTHVAFETSDVPRAGRVMRTLQDRLAVLLPHISAAQAAVAELRKGTALSTPVTNLLETASLWARSIAAGERTQGKMEGAGSTMAAEIYRSLRDQLAAFAAFQKVGKTSWQDLLEQTIVTNVEELVTALEDSRILALALEDPELKLPPRLAEEIATPGRRLLHRDRGLALLSACAAAGGTLIACALWIAGAWPEGAVAVQFAAIGCSLFATLDNPTKLISAAIVGIIVALPFGALYEFAIIPRVDGFASLALVLTPVLLLFSYMQTFEKLEGAALVLSIAFAGSLALQSTYRADFASFINSNTAEVVGLLIAVITNMIFRTIDPAWNAFRISRAGWRSVSRLARGHEMDVRRWTLQMFDRLGLVAARLGDAGAASLVNGHIDSLRDMRVGLGVAAIADNPGEPRLDEVLGLVAATYSARAGGVEGPPTPVMQRSIDAGITALAAASPSERQRKGLAALTSLRIDLAGSDTPYSLASESAT